MLLEHHITGSGAAAQPVEAGVRAGGKAESMHPSAAEGQGGVGALLTEADAIDIARRVSGGVAPPPHLLWSCGLLWAGEFGEVGTQRSHQTEGYVAFKVEEAADGVKQKEELADCFDTADTVNDKADPITAVKVEEGDIRERAGPLKFEQPTHHMKGVSHTIEDSGIGMSQQSGSAPQLAGGEQVSLEAFRSLCNDDIAVLAGFRRFVREAYKSRRMAFEAMGSKDHGNIDLAAFLEAVQVNMGIHDNLLILRINAAIVAQLGFG